jgi:hypothetical protein
MTYLYLNDNGRCTCAYHAGEYLRRSIEENPNAQFHKTPLTTWERIKADLVRECGLDCDRCTR